MLRPLTVVVCLGALAFPSLATAEPAVRAGGPRIRAQDARTARVLEDGLRRSPTLRALVDRIEMSDVIVYVGIDPMMKSYLAGSLAFVTSGGGFRYVRASISVDQVPDLMIATLAHEFQHVVEVIDDPSVVNESTLGDLYRRIGVNRTMRPSTGWETIAAQEVGAQVRRELSQLRRAAVASLEDVRSYDSRDL